MQNRYSREDGCHSEWNVIINHSRSIFHDHLGLDRATLHHDLYFCRTRMCVGRISTTTEPVIIRKVGQRLANETHQGPTIPTVMAPLPKSYLSGQGPEGLEWDRHYLSLQRERYPNWQIWRSLQCTKPQHWWYIKIDIPPAAVPREPFIKSKTKSLSFYNIRVRHNSAWLRKRKRTGRSAILATCELAVINSEIKVWSTWAATVVMAAAMTRRESMSMTMRWWGKKERLQKEIPLSLLLVYCMLGSYNNSLPRNDRSSGCKHAIT